MFAPLLLLISSISIAQANGVSGYAYHTHSSNTGLTNHTNRIALNLSYENLTSQLQLNDGDFEIKRAKLSTNTEPFEASIGRINKTKGLYDIFIDSPSSHGFAHLPQVIYDERFDGTSTVFDGAQLSYKKDNMRFDYTIGYPLEPNQRDINELLFDNPNDPRNLKSDVSHSISGTYDNFNTKVLGDITNYNIKDSKESITTLKKSISHYYTPLKTEVVFEHQQNLFHTTLLNNNQWYLGSHTHLPYQMTLTLTYGEAKNDNDLWDNTEKTISLMKQYNDLFGIIQFTDIRGESLTESRQDEKGVFLTIGTRF